MTAAVVVVADVEEDADEDDKDILATFKEKPQANKADGRNKKHITSGGQ